jgi:hypothetical protein
MPWSLRLSEVQADTVLKQDVEHAPEQLCSPLPRDRVEHDHH